MGVSGIGDVKWQDAICGTEGCLGIGECLKMEYLRIFENGVTGPI